jgi:hypothetical protein
MHKPIFLMLMMALCLTRPQQPALAKTQVRPTKKSDTTFLLKERDKKSYHIVYIERNRESIFYKNLLDFSITNKFDLKEYKENNIRVKKENPAPFKVYDLKDLPKEWMPIYRYKNKYYIYNPAEWGSIDRRVITDSTIMFWSMEAPERQPFINAKRIGKDTYQLKFHSLYPDTVIKNITIHIIDPKNKIAVWEDLTEAPQYRYGLYVPRENAANFDLIVNYCEQHKTDEFEFDKIDYKALLKGH